MKSELQHLRVKDKTCDVVLGHPGQLMGEHILQTNEPQHGLLGNLLGQRVANHMEFNVTLALLQLKSEISSGEVQHTHSKNNCNLCTQMVENCCIKLGAHFLGSNKLP